MILALSLSVWDIVQVFWYIDPVWPGRKKRRGSGGGACAGLLLGNWQREACAVQDWIRRLAIRLPSSSNIWFELLTLAEQHGRRIANHHGVKWRPLKIYIFFYLFFSPLFASPRVRLLPTAVAALARPLNYELRALKPTTPSTKLHRFRARCQSRTRSWVLRKRRQYPVCFVACNSFVLRLAKKEKHSNKQIITLNEGYNVCIQ